MKSTIRKIFQDASQGALDTSTMNIRIIACRVFEPEITHISQHSQSPVHVEYLPLRAHDDPKDLRAQLQAKLDDDDGSFDLVVLAYGLCGNAIAGLRAASTPILIPQAHDCSHILLGSTEAHQRYFGDTPSRAWTTPGYLKEDGDPIRGGAESLGYDLASLIEQYGEENGRYVYETMKGSAGDPVVYYLDVPETRDEALFDRARRAVSERGKELREIPATLSVLRELLLGGRGGEVLLVPPGATIQPSYDHRVIKVEVTQ